MSQTMAMLTNEMEIDSNYTDLMRARLSTYSLGFGHISVFSDDDIQSMPIIHRQHNSWNPREFHKYRLESLDKKIGGFKPLAIDNFITIAADRNLILMDTLTHSLRERDHRRMEWVEGMFKQEGRVFLVDGHHRALYMEEFVLRKFFDLRQVALQMERDLSAQKPCNGRLVGGIMKVIAQLERTIVHNSKWLAQVFDLEKIEADPDCELMKKELLKRTIYGGDNDC